MQVSQNKTAKLNKTVQIVATASSEDAECVQIIKIIIQKAKWEIISRLKMKILHSEDAKSLNFLMETRDEANGIWFSQEHLWQVPATISFSIALLKLHQKSCIQFGTCQSQNAVKKLETVQRRVIQMIKSLRGFIYKED